MPTTSIKAAQEDQRLTCAIQISFKDSRTIKVVREHVDWGVIRTYDTLDFVATQDKKVAR